MLNHRNHFVSWYWWTIYRDLISSPKNTRSYTVHYRWTNSLQHHCSGSLSSLLSLLLSLLLYYYHHYQYFIVYHFRYHRHLRYIYIYIYICQSLWNLCGEQQHVFCLDSYSGGSSDNKWNCLETVTPRAPEWFRDNILTEHINIVYIFIIIYTT